MRKGGSTFWQVEHPPAPRAELRLTDGTPLWVQIAPDTAFLNAQRIEESGFESGTKRRYIGYLPGQALTVEGTWEGNDLLTAHSLYAGVPVDYLRFLAYQPGAVLLMGMTCSGLGFVLIVIGVALRLLGK